MNRDAAEAALLGLWIGGLLGGLGTFAALSGQLPAAGLLFIAFGWVLGFFSAEAFL
jgi:hypothetical protein